MWWTLRLWDNKFLLLPRDLWDFWRTNYYNYLVNFETLEQRTTCSTLWTFETMNYYYNFVNFETNYYKQTTTTTWWTTGTRWARAQRAKANGTNPTLTLSSLLWAINGPQRCHPKSQYLSIFIPLFQVQPYFTAWMSSELWSDGRSGLRPVLHLCTLPTATSSNDAWEKTIFMNWLLSRDLVLEKRCFSTIHCPIKRFIIFCIGRWPEVSVDLDFVHQNTLGLRPLIFGGFVHQNTLGPLIFSTLRSPAVTQIYDLQVATHDTGGYHVSLLSF